MSNKMRTAGRIAPAARAFTRMQADDALLPAEASALKRSSALFFCLMVLVSAPLFWAANAAGIIGDVPTAVAHDGNSGPGSGDDDDGHSGPGGGDDDDDHSTAGTSARQDTAGTSEADQNSVTQGTQGTSLRQDTAGTSVNGDDTNTNGTQGTSLRQDTAGTTANDDTRTNA